MAATTGRAPDSVVCPVGQLSRNIYYSDNDVISTAEHASTLQIFAFAISILSETRKPPKHEPPNPAIDEVLKHRIINHATAVIIYPQQRVTGSRYLGNSERCPSLKAEQKLHLSS